LHFTGTIINEIHNLFYHFFTLRKELLVLKCCYGDSNPSRGRERPA
jgi:hypothetical protein